jgi:threonine aldolase
MSETKAATTSTSSVHVVDMRSDTVTKPTAEMRAAMAAADVGDDVFADDPTVNRLQQLAAAMLGTSTNGHRVMKSPRADR